MTAGEAAPRPGASNSLVDVPGIRVGQHQRVGDGWLTGSTVVVPPEGGAVAGVDVRGGGPGTRETDLLDPRNLVDRVHAVLLSGGSAYGLAAADGVMRACAATGAGFPCGEPGQVVPIVPAAVLFDLGRGGEFTATPDAAFGEAAMAGATTAPPALGVVGAGTGAQVGGLKGGIGSASQRLPGGGTVAALVAVNAVGSAVDPGTGRLWGAPLLLEEDLRLPATGGDGRVPGPPASYRLADPHPEELARAREAAAAVPAELGFPRTLATTIGVVATDLTLDKARCAKVAGLAHDGLARAVDPVHTMLDGDTFFALATGDRPGPDLPLLQELLVAAARCTTRAVVRAVLAAETVTTEGGSWRCYRDALPSGCRTNPAP